MGKGKVVSRLVALVAVLGLAFAATAVAYTLPLPPGSPGGPPTTPKGGSTTTQGGATSLGTKLAGQTSSELATHSTYTITVHFPGSGTILGSVINSKKQVIGQGFAGRANKGSGPMSLTFSAKGKAYLDSVNGQAVKLTIKLTFVPNAKHKKRVSSTVTITTVA
jgi:hypothetical protein